MFTFRFVVTPQLPEFGVLRIELGAFLTSMTSLQRCPDGRKYFKKCYKLLLVKCKIVISLLSGHSCDSHTSLQIFPRWEMRPPEFSLPSKLNFSALNQCWLRILCPPCCDRNSKRQFSDVSDPIKHVQCNIRDKPAKPVLLDTIKAKLLSAILLRIYWKIVGNIAARLIPSPIRSVAAV